MKKLIVAATIIVTLFSSLRVSIAAEEAATARRQQFRDGARLWPVYCVQCHNARPGSEFAPYQWDTILMHMRTQANLPTRDARAILEYLKSSR